MVMIRFQRLGTKKTPHHRIVVMDQRRAQSSRVLEVLGFYNPASSPAMFSVDESRVNHWVSSGAKVSEAVGQALKRHVKLAAAKAK